LRKNDLKQGSRKKRKLQTLPRKIVGEIFAFEAGISEGCFWKYVVLLRKATGVKPKRNKPRLISDL